MKINMHFTRLMLLFGWILIYSHEVSTTMAPCTENRTELCIDNLGTFIALGKPRFVNEAELERLCREAEYGQRCSSDFLRTSSCGKGPEEVLIQLQIGRSQEVSKMLCSIGGYVTDPGFRKLYLQQSPCIEEHEKEMKSCYRSANVIEDPELEVVRNSTKTSRQKHTSACCPLVQYIECSMNIIGTSCGADAKDVVLRMLQTASGKHLQEFCKSIDADFPNSPGSCFSSAVVQQVASWMLQFVSYCSIFIVARATF